MNTKTKTWKLNKKDFDHAIDPRDDFFHFVNGGWIKRNPIPKTETSWGTFYILRKQNRKILHDLLKNLIDKKNFKKGSDAQLVRDLYFTGMNTKKRNRDRTKDLQPFFDSIQAVKTKEDLAKLIGDFHKAGIGTFWNTFVDQDMNKSTHMMVWLYQGGFGLPERDYYFPKNKKEKELLANYKKHIKAIFKLNGDKEKVATKKAQTVLRIETKLAASSMNREERYDYHKQNNRKTHNQIKTLYKQIAWEDYFKTIHLKKIRVVNVAQPNFFKEVDGLLKQISLPDIKTYLLWCVLDSFSNVLSDDFVNASFSFYGKKLSGQKEIKPRWERVLGIVEGNLREASGKVYIKKYFTQQSKQKMDILVDDVIDAYRERLKSNAWMSKTTKKKALKKLGTIRRKIGYPEKWEGYKGLRLSSDSFVHNLIALSEFHYRRNLQKAGKKVDRTKWHFSPATVNACYDPGLNDITFPAGILQPPFFDVNAPDAINYGAIGSVIGHELTHGFDDSGSKFDAYGNLKNWWTREDRKKFEKRTSTLVSQFNNAKLFDGLHVNGKMTLGENIADLGGAVIAYDAYKRFKKRNKIKDYTISGFDDEQLFFIGLAVIERGHVQKESIRQRLITDPHSPPEFRINIPFSNMESFYEVFGVTPKNKLYRNKKQRAEIW
tara:strand:- start:15170 stop:17149 length:1980 start_codon:yes stop_codon:yes gene_type:complete